MWKRKEIIEPNTLAIYSNISELGFKKNSEKSPKYPGQIITHLGMVINTREISLKVPPKQDPDLIKRGKQVAECRKNEIKMSRKFHKEISFNVDSYTARSSYAMMTHRAQELTTIQVENMVI
ncbi:hypothetical protein AYI70_g11762 [Smittium culicis]|uniref:Uncharacterized protein n=1 Tax=Smittium culicis TaxID=133412 RepID=A0A1R1X0H0_9FUNG|nr:hypothetical protein AYI70_g11762 [Smittium culicis]